MAACNIYVFAFFTALVAVNLIFAEESSLESKFFDQVDVSDSAERDARSPNEDGDGEASHERLFFNLFPITTGCNYTTQPGNTCASCSQAIRCLSNNVGIVRNCRGFLPYCNGGRCSFIPGPLCFNSTG